MKRTRFLSLLKFSGLVALCLLLAPTTAQNDTLHLDYHHTQFKAHDSTIAKIEAWAKSLNGKHVDIDVVGYFHKPEFRKAAQARCDELFLIINRKARDLVSIKFIGPRKGEYFQRTRVDIIYRPTISEEEAKAAAAKLEAEKAAKKEAEKAAAAEKAAKKEAEKKKAEGEKEKSKEGDKDKDVAGKEGKGKDKSKDDGKEGDDGGKEGDDEEKDYGHASTQKLNEGQNAKLEDMKYLQGAKIIVAQVGRAELDQELLKAAKDHWNLSSDITSMPYNEAREMAKNSKDTLAILSMALVKAWHEEKKGPVTYKILRIGHVLCLESGKGKTLISQYIPVVKGKGASPEQLAFGVSALNRTCKDMLEQNAPKVNQLADLYKEQADELKTVTVLLPESMVHPSLPQNEIRTYYNAGKISVVPDDEWKQAILQKKNNVAYIMIAPVPTKNKTYVHYIVNAGNGKIYMKDWGPTIQFKAANVTQSGYVDKSNLERYNESILYKDQQAAKADAKAKKEEEKSAKKKAKEEKKDDEGEKKDEGDKQENKKGKKSKDE